VGAEAVITLSIASACGPYNRNRINPNVRKTAHESSQSRHPQCVQKRRPRHLHRRYIGPEPEYAGSPAGRRKQDKKYYEQQRVATARALANRTKLILADEPTGFMDSASGKMIFDLLHDLSRRENTTIIVVTHDLQIAGKTDKTFKLDDGKLVK
jgi:ABC-type transport system involved in Fe-S cluster assembly fused permease/ATPase subunit